MKNKKVIAIVSGGLDSTVMLYWLLKIKKVTPIVLSFNYNQRHKKELGCIKQIASELKLQHKIIKLPISDIVNSSALINKTKKLPKEHYTHENQKITVVANRNMIMLSIAVAYAENLGIKKVYYAAHKNDESIYLDCRKKFVEQLSKATQLATYNKVKVIAPFVNKYKSDLVKIGNQLKVPFEKTMSCYEGRKKACGLCATCQERIEAFIKNNLIDPIEYE